jgi:glycosyltransferase involved in cell wall biosynthesis
LAQSLGIASNVVFVGVRNDMPGVYASLDILVLPSLVESMPMCLLEAMAAGKPVIATRLGAVPQLILPDQTGILLEPGEVTPLAEAILRLRMNPDLALRLGANAHTHVARHYSAEAMARNYIEQYHRAMGCRETNLEISASTSA